MTYDELPRIGDCLEPEVWRPRVLAVRERMAATTARARSADNLISAAVGGRGELLELHIDPRVYELSDSRALARDITGVVRVAIARAKAAIAADLPRILADRSG